MGKAVEVGQRLAQARKDAGYTQTQVGNLLNMAYQNYQKYESGKVELSYDKLVFLCELFQVSADYLLGLDDER